MKHKIKVEICLNFVSFSFCCVGLGPGLSCKLYTQTHSIFADFHMTKQNKSTSSMSNFVMLFCRLFFLGEPNETTAKCIYITYRKEKYNVIDKKCFWLKKQKNTKEKSHQFNLVSIIVDKKKLFKYSREPKVIGMVLVNKFQYNIQLLCLLALSI